MSVGQIAGHPSGVDGELCPRFAPRADSKRLRLHSNTVSAVSCLADAAAIFVVAFMAFRAGPMPQWPCPPAPAALVAAGLAVACLAVQRAYGRKAALGAIRLDRLARGWLQFFGLLVVALTLFALMAGAPAPGVPSSLAAVREGTRLAGLLVFGFAALAGLRFAWAGLRRVMPDHIIVAERTLVIGALGMADTVAAQLRQNPRCGADVVGVLAADGPDGFAEIAAAVRDLRADTVVISLPWEDSRAAGKLAGAASRLPVLVRLAADPAVLAPQRRGTATPLPLLITVSDVPIRGAAALAKRLEDVLVAGTALVILAPLMAAIALAIRIDSPGPVLFRQPREGYGGRLFSMLKFRTMRVECTDIGADRQTSRSDNRVTAVGAVLRRHSLDELPQLLNVLAGDMSVVGPRPHALSTRAEGTLLHEAVEAYASRFRVKPGITGWAQVNGARGEIDTKAKLARRVAMDVDYIDRWSLVLDLRIMLRSVSCMVHDDAAF